MKYFIFQGVVRVEVAEEARLEEAPQRVEALQVVLLDQVEHLLHHRLRVEGARAVALAVRGHGPEAAREPAVQQVLQHRLIHRLKVRLDRKGGGRCHL